MWVRLRQLALVAEHLAPVVDDLHAVFGLEVAFRDPAVGRFGLENAVLPVGNQFLEVVAPTREGTTGGRYLERRGGNGGYMVILQCDDHAPRKARIDELGIRKVVEHDEPDYQLLQLHPQDTGGSFLEIDVQVGGEDPSGPWMPAGPDWRTAVSTSRVSGIAAAELQSPAPGPLADRWAAILDLPVDRDVEDRPQLGLENATIRFAVARDGRGEGLGGIQLMVVDRTAVLGAAAERGLLHAEEVIVLGGVRFTLADAASVEAGDHAADR